ncbi:MAG: flagellar hook-basal body complex protein, partial [Planctomycetota bacterium]
RGGKVFTRDGSFSINPSHLLHDAATGFIVQGYMADEEFQITPGGPLENLEIPIGTQTIAKKTTDAVFIGNLDSDGEVGGAGSLQLSEIMYDDRFTNNDLISSVNPLGLERATNDTPLHNLVRSLGDFVTFTEDDAGLAATSTFVFPELQNQLTGVDITLTGLKGDRALPETTFVVGDPPPTGGTTLGDFINFMGRAFGVNDGNWDGIEQTENTYSYVRTNPFTGEQVNGTLSEGQLGGLDDQFSLGQIIDRQADYRSVKNGDFLRFTSGAAAGQIAEIVAITASTAGGNLDTLTLRTDGFNSLTVSPAMGDTYEVHAGAQIALAEDTDMLTLDSSDASVVVGVPATNVGVRSFTVQDMTVSSLSLEEGIAPNQEVQYMSGGTLVSGFVSTVTDDTVTIAYDSTLSQDPDAGTTFDFIDLADGTIEVASNAGTLNGIDDIEMHSEGERIGLFDRPSISEASGESATLTTTVYDSLGTPRQVELTFVFEGSSANGPNTWRYFAESVDDSDMDRVVGSGTVIFNGAGQYVTTGTSVEQVVVDLDATPGVGGGVDTPFMYALDFSRMTQFATPFSPSEIQMQEQDGFEAGVLRDFSVGLDGIITGVFTNGLSRSLGQVVLSNFANPNGLDAEGGNYFRRGVNSGIPQIGLPGTFGRGTVQSGILEESNVDLALQFTDLVIGQRAYQANARTITVSDELLQELVNLI